MILAGLWFQRKEPDMNLFFQPFVEQANKLQNNGFKWNWNNEERVGYLHPLGLCVDTPAAVLKMSTFYGYNGCTYCHQRGDRIDGVMKWPYKESAAADRTDEEIRKRMMNPHPDKERNDGIWTASFLVNLKTMNLVKGIPIDFLHAICEGGAKLFTNIVTSASKKGKKKVWI